VGSEERRRRYVSPRRQLDGDHTAALRRFKALARDAVNGLPEHLRARIDNVAIIVRGRPTAHELRASGVPRGGTLLGLYQGTPLPLRNSGYTMALPDRIYLFREPLEAISRTDEQLVAQIRRTVLHELAHHFGISDARLHEIGAY
jgi:predicted Zn-dependent protease with MMP-like domain